MEKFEELKQKVIEQVKKLSRLEQNVLILRLGLGENPPITLEEVATRLGSTPERIRQIETKAFRKLRHPKKR